MAHEMKSFEHIICERNVSLNTVMVDGAPWFRGTDVAEALDYANPRQAIRQNVHDEDRAQLKDLGRLPDSPPLKHNESTQVFISESALYRTQLKDLGPLVGRGPLNTTTGSRPSFLRVAYIC